VAQEEGTSQALREEAQRRETALQQLRTAVKEVSSISQAFSYRLLIPDFSVCFPHPCAYKSPVCEEPLLNFLRRAVGRYIASSFMLKALGLF
jgi:hypothetical protein